MTQMQQASNQPGQYFDFPGYPGGATQWADEDETSTNLSTVLSGASQTPLSSVLPFRQTDVVVDWQMLVNVAQTYTVGTSALTASAYAPFNVLGPVQVRIQNQYSSIDVESGIDLYIFNMIRPFSSGEILSGVNDGANPAGFPVGGSAAGYAAAALAQPNNLNAAQWGTGATGYQLWLRIPAAQWFDEYYDLALTGECVNPPHSALVSPQFMAGTTRNITPSVKFNQGGSGAPTTDIAPVSIGAGTGTYVGSTVTRFRRRSVYAGDPAILPPIYAWQYSWRTTRSNTPGASRVVIPFPTDIGQVLSCYVRLFDPSAAGGIGAPIALSTLTLIEMIYGSGLRWFSANNDASVLPGELVQRRWLQTHASFLPAGVFAFEFAIDDRQQMSNKRCLNTLTTGGILIRYAFSAPLSQTAYAVLGTESLVYVS